MEQQKIMNTLLEISEKNLKEGEYLDVCKFLKSIPIKKERNKFFTIIFEVEKEDLNTYLEFKIYTSNDYTQRYIITDNDNKTLTQLSEDRVQDYFKIIHNFGCFDIAINYKCFLIIDFLSDKPCFELDFKKLQEKGIIYKVNNTNFKKIYLEDYWECIDTLISDIINLDLYNR